VGHNGQSFTDILPDDGNFDKCHLIEALWGLKLAKQQAGEHDKTKSFLTIDAKGIRASMQNRTYLFA